MACSHLIATLLVWVFISLSFFTLPSMAKVWRVDNTNNADFSSFTDAHSAAVDGDTVYVAGSVQLYGSPSLTKRLTIFGPGYFLAENPKTQAKLNSAQFSTIFFSNGSEGTVVSGIMASDLDVRVNDVVIRRNRLTRDLIIRSSVANLIAAQNYIERNISVSTDCSNILILNNIMPDPANLGGVSVSSSASSSLELSHNVIFRNISVHNSTITNNIFKTDEEEWSARPTNLIR